jgi:segregation and condensation protein B
MSGVGAGTPEPNEPDDPNGPDEARGGGQPREPTAGDLVDQALAEVAHAGVNDAIIAARGAGTHDEPDDSVDEPRSGPTGPEGSDDERGPGWESEDDWERNLRLEREVAERAAEAEAAAAEGTSGHDIPTLARIIEGLLFLSPDPVPAERLAEATGAGEDAVAEAIAQLDRTYAPGERGLIVKRVAGGITFGTDPICESAARALLSTQRIPPLTAAQAETLAIVAYLQPVARPEISRIRGVAADSATATLLERGLIEESGRSEFGAVLYRTTSLFLRLFGIDSLGALPDVSTWDPAPEEEDELRDRLLRAGSARSGGAGGGPAVELPEPRELGEDPGHVDMPGDRFIGGNGASGADAT